MRLFGLFYYHVPDVLGFKEPEMLTSAKLFFFFLSGIFSVSYGSNFTNISDSLQIASLLGVLCLAVERYYFLTNSMFHKRYFVMKYYKMIYYHKTISYNNCSG